jgi:ankyrin repeat protein
MQGLRLDRRRDAMPNRVGANRAQIVPGNAAASPLYRRISGTQAGAQMPPPGPLQAEQIAAIKTWIDQGAEWPDQYSGDRDSTPADPAVVKMRDALRDDNRAEFNRAVRENPKSLQGRGPGGWTPLMYAALYGGADVLRLLLGKGADPNAQNAAGGTALMYAVDDIEKVRILLEHGAKPNLVSGEGRSALLIAAGWAGSYSTVKLLLDSGADPKLRLPDGRGVLRLAMNAADPQLMQLLIEHGAEKKPLPLAQALSSGCKACFEALLKFAEPGDLTNALHGALMVGDLPLMQDLFDRGAKPGPTTLQLAALSPVAIPAGTIKSLLARGADGNGKTRSGIPMIDFARMQGNVTMVQALAESGVKEQATPTSRLQPKPTESLRAAIGKSIPALQRADVTFLQKAGCVSCHNNSLTAMTVSAARTKGLPVNEQIARDQLRKIAAFLDENGERALENSGIPGGIDTVSYVLLGMAAENYPGDTITDVWARYLKNNQSSGGQWICQTQRPPLEASHFQVTAASIRSLLAYGPKSQRSEYDRAVQRAVAWLEKAQPRTSEDHAFKVLGLVWGRAGREAIRNAARELLALQRGDGGWGQVPTLASDAYATGQALVALNEARLIAPQDHAYQRGVTFLRNSQLEDGSWHVRTRSIAIQPHFDSDFPHGLDQFISAAASNWATMALTAALR